MRRLEPIALPDPRHREQQDRGRDRHENVVEAGQQAELLFVRDDTRALPLDMGAEGIGCGGCQDARGDGVVKLLLAVHVGLPRFARV